MFGLPATPQQWHGRLNWVGGLNRCAVTLRQTCEVTEAPALFSKLRTEVTRLDSRQEHSHVSRDTYRQPATPAHDRGHAHAQASDKTQSQYVHAVCQFTAFLGHAPDTASTENLRRYKVHLVDHGISPVSLNAAITGLKFFFEVTLGDAQRMAKMRPVRVPRTLPVVLSPDEVGRLLAAAGNLKHQTALAVAYGAGLRASEVVALKVTDIDSERMTLRIEQGKGCKDRYAMLSPVLIHAGGNAIIEFLSQLHASRGP